MSARASQPHACEAERSLRAGHPGILIGRIFDRDLVYRDGRLGGGGMVVALQEGFVDSWTTRLWFDGRRCISLCGHIFLSDMYRNPAATDAASGRNSVPALAAQCTLGCRGGESSFRVLHLRRRCCVFDCEIYQRRRLTRCFHTAISSHTRRPSRSSLVRTVSGPRHGRPAKSQ